MGVPRSEMGGGVLSRHEAEPQHGGRYSSLEGRRRCEAKSEDLRVQTLPSCFVVTVFKSEALEHVVHVPAHLDPQSPSRLIDNGMSPNVMDLARSEERLTFPIFVTEQTPSRPPRIGRGQSVIRWYPPIESTRWRYKELLERGRLIPIDEEHPIRGVGQKQGDGEVTYAV